MRTGLPGHIKRRLFQVCQNGFFHFTVGIASFDKKQAVISAQADNLYRAENQPHTGIAMIKLAQSRPGRAINRVPLFQITIPFLAVQNRQDALPCLFRGNNSIAHGILKLVSHRADV